MRDGQRRLSGCAPELAPELAEAAAYGRHRPKDAPVLSAPVWTPHRFGIFNESNAEVRQWLADSPPRAISIELHDRFDPAKYHREVVDAVLTRCGFRKNPHEGEDGTVVLYVRASKPGPDCVAR